MMFPFCILAIENNEDRLFMEGLYMSYHRLMYSIILKMLKDKWDVEDVLQTVLVKLIDKIQILQAKNQNQLVNYIISCCRNEAYSFLRARSRFCEEDNIDDLADAELDAFSLDVGLLKQEDIACLVGIWPHLDEKTRFVLEGYYFLERSTDELGTELGIKPASVRMELSRARKEVFKLLIDRLDPAE